MGDRGDRGRGERGGFGRGFGDRGRGRGDRGRGRGDGGRRGAKGEGEWVPCTKLGRLVKEGLIKSLEQVYLYSLKVKEYQVRRAAPRGAGPRRRLDGS